MHYGGIGATNEHARLIMESYQRLTGQSLLGEPASDSHPFEQLFNAPCVVLSHGTETDPVLNFGNRAALELWAMDWDKFTSTPSRLTAEPMEREARSVFLKTVGEQGYIDNYTGIRISSTGRRFHILEATVWNLTDETGKIHGQAAAFREYRYV
ncbi:MEKHLA domain-containing protein [Paenibacillus rhizosphaerae]|uniref:MEKHLA domain-containing protein n=1 Tax=Paenibacillus rhizosphaerae TaxID=297318 RepID=A0A1R1E520_9BACL|nr:MEKHLA domain-containing protein [Paenibacillus rhizosphaerae]OMF46898.1 MEKHLA domain-containing protein [Paenibacillus rhizosphaerae]